MLAEFKKRANRLKREVYALYLATRHPETPCYAKLIVAGVVAYAFSPIDLIPDFIPVLGYLDDFILIPLGSMVAIKLIPPQVLAECHNKANEATASKPSGGRFAAVVIVCMWVLLLAICILWAFEAFAVDAHKGLMYSPH